MARTACLLFAVLAALSVVASGIRFDASNFEGIIPVGVKQPGQKHERARRESYSPDKPFFQWWYFWVRDLQENVNYGLSFDLSYCGSSQADCDDDGFYAMFSQVDRSTKKNFAKYEQYPFDDFNRSGDFNLKVTHPDDAAQGTGPTYSLTALDDNTFRITGRMVHPDRQWTADGIATESTIEWDLTLKRVYGWYGQNLFEIPARLTGVIQWNTYAHDCLVTGSIKITEAGATRVMQLDGSNRYRAYADMNWGIDFPSPPPSIAEDDPAALDFAWGWYYAGQPATDTTPEISIIGGVGLCYVDKIIGNMTGRFIDVRIGDGTSLETIQVGGWEETPFGMAITVSTDGDQLVHDFHVERSDWITYEDDRGKASLPLSQVLYLKTQHYEVTLSFTSDESAYNRLLFPRQGYVFSDFEALGVNVKAVVTKDGNTIASFENANGGVEFGYRVAMKNTPSALPKANLPSVVVLGGGIGGLTAAHELSSRGFKVSVYEELDMYGGKARSYGAAGTGTDGRPDFPAEHGFRIFAGEYGATRDTMARIPDPSQDGNTVVDHMVEGTQALFTAPMHETTFRIPSHFPTSFEEFKEWITYFKTVSTYISKEEVLVFMERILIVMSSSIDRRFAEFEDVAWWDYMFGDEHSRNYQDLIRMISGNILAANPRNANAHVVGYLAGDLLCRTLVPGEKGLLYMLDGPTSQMWIDPWVSHLENLGVSLSKNKKVTAITMTADKSEIESITVVDTQTGKEEVVKGDIFFASVPAEKMAELLTPELTAAAPSLQNVGELQTAWMVGFQLYLRKNIDIVGGTIGFLHSPWALAGVSQEQFRPWMDMSKYGNGEAQGVLSLTVSNWTTPGQYVCKKPALECTKEEVAQEVWAQVKAWLPSYNLTDDDLVAWTIDEGLSFKDNGAGVPLNNYSPLFINTPFSWVNRPNPQTEVKNLFVGSDYAKAPQNVACMETANQASRIGVNALLDQLQISEDQAPRCEIYPSEENSDGQGFIIKALLKPFIELDEKRFKEGKPHIGCKCPACTCPASEESEIDPEWKKLVEDVLTAFNTFAEQAEKQYSNMA